MTGNFPSSNCIQPAYEPIRYAQAPGCSSPLLLGGDVKGLANDNIVESIQNIKWSPVTPYPGQIPQYDNSGQWTFVTPTTFSTLSTENGNGLILTGSVLSINYPSLISTGDLLTNTQADLNYLKLSGGAISGNLTVSGNSQLTEFSTTGTNTLQTLAGVGTRMVVASASGVLSTQAVPSSNIYAVENLGPTGEGVLASVDNLTGTIKGKKLIQGSNIILTSTSTGVSISATNVGEVNTLSSVGSGISLVSPKVGADLQILSLLAGSNISIAPSGNSLLISATNVGEINTGTNVGAGSTNTAFSYIDNSGTALRFRRQVGSSSVTIAQSGTDIVYTSPDQALSISGNVVTLSGNSTGPTTITLPVTALTPTDTSTVDFNLAGSVLTATFPLRVNSSTVSLPAGSSPIGYNLTSTGGTVAITNTVTGAINFEATGIVAYYLADSAATGNVTATVNTNSQVTSFKGTFSANRTITLQTAGAVLGSRIEISTVLAATNLNGFNLNVVDQATSTTLKVVNTNTRLVFIFNGTSFEHFA